MADAAAIDAAVSDGLAPRWLAAGRVAPGVHPPETAVVAGEFLADLETEGVEVALSKA